MKVLKRFGREIRRKMPVNPLAQMKKRLERAIRSENYEQAAVLRDQIAMQEREAAKSNQPI